MRYIHISDIILYLLLGSLKEDEFSSIFDIYDKCVTIVNRYILRSKNFLKIVGAPSSFQSLGSNTAFCCLFSTKKIQRDMP
jgi:hypothetical protein